MIAADEQMRGGKAIPPSPPWMRRMAWAGSDAVRHTIVYKRTGGNVAYGAKTSTGQKSKPVRPDERPAEMVLKRRASAVRALHLGPTGKPEGRSTRPVVICCTPC